MLESIGSFRDKWLEEFFDTGKSHAKIPADIESVLARKLDIINAAVDFRDLRSPPGNRFENLESPLQEYSSIRVNDKYRILFKWVNGKAEQVYFEPHKYKKHK